MAFFSRIPITNSSAGAGSGNNIARLRSIASGSLRHGHASRSKHSEGYPPPGWKSFVPRSGRPPTNTGVGKRPRLEL
jgi:hypothetical protein